MSGRTWAAALDHPQDRSAGADPSSVRSANPGARFVWGSQRWVGTGPALVAAETFSREFFPEPKALIMQIDPA